MTVGASFLALGDSFTEGLHDEPGADGRHRGWADRVAEALAHQQPNLVYGNLAVRGRLVDEVVEEQLPIALARSADVVSFHAGANDLLRPRADLGRVTASYDRAVAQLREAGSTVLLFTVLERAGGTGRLSDALARRFARFNAVVRATAHRHGARLADVGRVPAMHDRRLWDEDRLHLAPAGHARVAAAALEALGVKDPALPGGDWWREPLPAGPAVSRAARLRADAHWSGRHLAPWIGRRLRGVSSGDDVTCKRAELTPVRPR